MTANDLAYLIGAVLLACLAGFTASIVATERRARRLRVFPPMHPVDVETFMALPSPFDHEWSASRVRVVRLVDWEQEGWLS